MMTRLHSHRSHAKALFLPLILGLVGMFAGLNAHADLKSTWFSAAKAGIYQARFDDDKGVLSELRQTVSGIDSNYLVQHPMLRVLYSINLRDGGGEIAAYTIHMDGHLERFSAFSTECRNGAHISVSPDGRLLAVAYYSSGHTGIYALDEQGAIRSKVLEYAHKGSSVDPRRQREPHPHWTGFDRAGKHLFVTDLGTDQIWVYRVNAAKGKAAFSHTIKVSPGSGPRHLAFHPSEPWAYVSDELSAGVSFFHYDVKKATLKRMESRSGSLSAKRDPKSNVSDIRIHPSGRFLYVVNRIYDQVTTFAINPETGMLLPVQDEPIRGTISRNMVLSENGRWALVSGSVSGSIAVFKLDQDSGELSFVPGQWHAVPNARGIVIDGYAN